MSLQSVCWLVYLLVTIVTHSQGFQFSMTRTPNNSYCGYLQCSVNISQTDTHINTLIGLQISDIVQGNTHIRLASVSLFDSEPHVDPTRLLALNATGSVTRYHGSLSIALRDETDCQFRSFLCELTFVNVSNLPDRVSETVASEMTDMCEMSSDPIATMVFQMKTHSINTDRKFTNMEDKLSQLGTFTADMDGKLTNIERMFTELISQNITTQQDLEKLRDQNVAIETKLDQILDQLSAFPKEDNTSQLKCARGAPHTRPREIIKLWGIVPAVCDTETDGGGWVIIQRRRKCDADFDKGWDDYKKGFGTPDTDHWLGNDNIHNLTSQGYVILRVDMEYQSVNYFAEYSYFSVADEISKYKLTVRGYHGNATDQLSHNSGMYFTTYDRDNDQHPDENCAATNQYHGAWWHNYCSFINLNGLWGAQDISGMTWNGVVYPGSVTWSEMKIRQI